MEMNFVPECYFDTVLIKSILKVKKVNHQHGCQNVINEMISSKGLKDDFAVAIIDNDRKVLKYIKDECFVLAKLESLHLLKHHTKHHFIIQLVPAVERWVLNVIDEDNVNIEDLDLPKDLVGLKELTKYKFANENENLKRLCKRLANSNGKTITTLTLWLQHLYQYHRNADINILKAYV